MKEQIITLTDLANRVGVTRPTIYDWERSGLLPPRRIFGKRKGWLLSTIEEWEQGAPHLETETV